MPFVGGLLEHFRARLERSGYSLEVREKPAGNHVTPWWIYLTLDSAKPRQSTVVFGETTFARVNPRPHLWVRGKAHWIRLGEHLLQDFMASMRLVHTAFNEDEAWGREFLEIGESQLVQILQPATPEGWALGYTCGFEGWFPAACVD